MKYLLLVLSLLALGVLIAAPVPADACYYRCGSWGGYNWYNYGYNHYGYSYPYTYTYQYNYPQYGSWYSWQPWRQANWWGGAGAYAGAGTWPHPYAYSYAYTY